MKSSSNLDSLAPGQTATISQLETETALHQRLYALGFRQGRQIHLLRRSWLSGPLHIRVGTTEVMLRRKEAQAVGVVNVSSGAK